MNLIDRQKELEEKHSERLAQIKKLLRRGDWKNAEEKTGLSQTNVHHAFKRIGSVNHFAVVEALEESISNRLKRFEQVPHKKKP